MSKRRPSLSDYDTSNYDDYEPTGEWDKGRGAYRPGGLKHVDRVLAAEVSTGWTEPVRPAPARGHRCYWAEDDVPPHGSYTGRSCLVCGHPEILPAPPR